MSQRPASGEASDPRYRAPADFTEQPPIEPPGTERELRPKADHGEATYEGYGRLRGKVALITGGDSGIGRAVAIAFAREGADVVISYLSEEEDALETARWVRDAGREELLASGDIQDAQHCDDLIHRTLARFGRLDVLVNNAAYQREMSSIEELTPEELDRTFRTNVYATIWLTKGALRSMRPGSVIINTSSIQAYNPSPGLLAYAPTKAAIVNFTKAISKQAMTNGIRVNAVAPGPVWTPLIPSTLTPEHVERFGKDTSFERPAQPAEIAPLFVFLASQDAQYVTGEVFPATGGRTPF